MRAALVGLGVQGGKRKKVAQAHVVATVDPVNPSADFSKISDLSDVNLDYAILCIPDDEKIPVLNYFLDRGCDVLVEKPLMGHPSEIREICQKFQSNNLILYTAYNHRFEPHFIKIKEILGRNEIGKIYSLTMHYGNGTSRLVKDSSWRDSGLGIVSDIGSHLLDLLAFWFGEPFLETYLSKVELRAKAIETKKYDNFTFIGESNEIRTILSGSFLNWKNRFFLEIVGAAGIIEMSGLCKWGPSTLTVHRRVYPAGIPHTESITLEKTDPTWDAEYKYFMQLRAKRIIQPHSTDLILNNFFQKLISEMN